MTKKTKLQLFKKALVERPNEKYLKEYIDKKQEKDIFMWIALYMIYLENNIKWTGISISDQVVSILSKYMSYKEIRILFTN